MLQSFLSRIKLISLSTTLAVLAVACSKDKLLTTTVFNEQPTPTVTSSPASPDPQPTNTPSVIDPSSFEIGLDKAASGLTITKSASSTEDWNLVVSQFQDAIAFMKQVPTNSPDFDRAQRKIKEYQRLIKYAKHKANPPLKAQPKPQPVVVVVPTPYTPPVVAAPLQRTVDCRELSIAKKDICHSVVVKRTLPTPVPSPELLNQQQEVFIVPIKRRAGGTPIIEVTFNGNQQFEMILDTGASGTVITQEMANALGVVSVGKAKANTASSKSVVFPIGYVDSIEVGGLMVHQVAVAIAGSDLETGLLGHDFFGEYDITIKRDVVEFRPQSNSPINSPATGLTFPTSPNQRHFIESP